MYKKAARRSHNASSSSEVRAALDAFRRIVQALRAGRAGEQFAGLSSARLFALQQIAEHPDASINDIAALTFTHQSSVSVVIQGLVKEGLVAKIAARDDRRRQSLALTAKGRQALQRAPAAAQEQLIAGIAALPASDRRSLVKSLNEIARLMTPHDAPPHPPMFFEDGSGSAKRTRN